MLSLPGTERIADHPAAKQQEIDPDETPLSPLA